MHARGYAVAVTGQSPDSIADARRELPDAVLVLRADTRNLADTNALLDSVRERFGSLDLLFLNARRRPPLPGR